MTPQVLKFVPPDWFTCYARPMLKGCSRHFDVCQQVEEDLSLLNNNSKEAMSDDGGGGGEPNYDFLTRYWGNGVIKGDKFDIPTLLASHSRDYLVKYNGDKIQIKDHFSNKRLLLLLWNMSSESCFLPHKLDPELCADSKEIYQQYGPFGPFGKLEVVFVALGNNHKVFDEAFSVMPWLAIPHEDQDTRDFIGKLFPKTTPALRSILFDLDGTILLNSCNVMFRFYGPEGFPFTKEKIAEIHNAEKALLEELFSFRKLPLPKLLGDFVISSEGKVIRTSDLEDHTVGLHFYGITNIDDRSTQLLMDTWTALKDDPSKKFAIVAIHDACDSLFVFKDKYPDEYKNIPWYRLPFEGRSLCRVLNIMNHKLNFSEVSSTSGRFIILEPDRYQPFNYFALDIVEMYGIDAFPFTLERAVEIEKSKQQLELGKLLSLSTSVLRGCSKRHKVDIASKLLGNRVLLLFATSTCYEAGFFLPALKRMYVEKRGTNDQFEILYISLDCENSRTNSFSSSIKEMPWLVHSYCRDFGIALAEKVFQYTPRLPAIAAFGSDGNLQTMESDLLFKETWSSEYPFIQADTTEDVCMDLRDSRGWYLETIFPQFSSPK